MASVSVIVSLYNKEKYIARALDSVLKQTWRDLEVIVVDDGSTDGGPKVVGGFRDDRVRLIRQKNVGPGAARNRGVRESSAPYVAFLDADDEWLPVFLETSLRRLRDNPECKASCAGFHQGLDRVSCEERLRAWGITDGPWRLPPDMAPVPMKKAVEALWTGTVVCRRDVVERFGGFYAKDRCTYGEDNYLWVRIVLNCRIYRDPSPLAWYHTEASDLGIHGREGVRPPVPILTDPEPVRAGCRPEYRDTLERYLAHIALLTARRHFYAGDRSTARWAVRTFPRMRELGTDYLKLRCEMASGPLIRLIARSPTLFRWYEGLTGGRGIA